MITNTPGEQRAVRAGGYWLATISGVRSSARQSTWLAQSVATEPASDGADKPSIDGLVMHRKRRDNAGQALSGLLGQKHLCARFISFAVTLTALVVIFNIYGFEVCSASAQSSGAVGGGLLRRYLFAAAGFMFLGMPLGVWRCWRLIPLMQARRSEVVAQGERTECYFGLA